MIFYILIYFSSKNFDEKREEKLFLNQEMEETHNLLEKRKLGLS